MHSGIAFPSPSQRHLFSGDVCTGRGDMISPPETTPIKSYQLANHNSVIQSVPSWQNQLFLLLFKTQFYSDVAIEKKTEVALATYISVLAKSSSNGIHVIGNFTWGQKISSCRFHNGFKLVMWIYCSCGSVVEHYVSNAKVMGSIPSEHMYW